MQIEELAKAYPKLLRKYDIYAAKLEELKARRDTIRKKVGQAKYRLGLKSDVTAVLDDLRLRSHQRVLGTIESLLTAAVVDVMGDNNRKVVLDLDTSRGLPDLQFSIMREFAGKLAREDILHSSGLSYSNVLSTALRVIAMESGHMRRFLLLDETDKYLAPENVPYYTSLIKNLATDFNTQILMISHHSAENFAGCNITRVKKIGPTADSVDQVALEIQNPYPEWRDTDIGIRSLHLINFESHADTTLFLSPNVSVVQGQNGIGKSTIHRALSALAGQSNDKIIRHFTAEAIVDAEIQGDRIIRFSRHRTRNPKVTFSLFNKSDMSKPVRQENMAKSVPDWVFDLLGLGTLNGIEIQLCWQGDSFFLLDKAGSKAAELLSLGKESDYIKDMELAYKSWVTQDTQTVKNGEKDLANLELHINAIYETVKSLREFPDFENSVSSLIESAKLNTKMLRMMGNLRYYAHIGDRLDVSFLSFNTTILEKLNTDHTTLNNAEKVGHVFPRYLFLKAAATPDLVLTLQYFEDTYSSVYETSRMVYNLKNYAPFKVSILPDYTVFDGEYAANFGKQASLLNKLTRYAHIKDTTIPEHAITIPEPVKDTSVFLQLKDDFNHLTVCEKDYKQAATAEKMSEDQWTAWIAANGGICPACEQPFNYGQHKHRKSDSGAKNA
jgi:DNA repair ATPase RecN